MKKELLTIAIDGPASSGKTTIAMALAEKLDILYLNTGALYRALGLKCLKENLNPLKESVAKEIAKSDISVKYQNGKQRVILDGKDVTGELFNEKVGHYASEISTHIVIREKLVEIQRQVASSQDIIVDGRDIGSVVLPLANFKFFLDAQLEERAKRRYNDLKKTDKNITLKEVERDLRERDYNDIHRKNSPLRLCEDAIFIDSTHMTVNEVIDAFMQIINTKLKEKGDRPR